MFTVRRLLSVGLRTTLPQLRENARSVQSLPSPVLSVDKSVANESRKASPWRTGPKSPEVVEDDERLKKIYEVIELDYTCPKCNGINDIVAIKKAYERGSISRRCRGCGTQVAVVDHLACTVDHELCKSIRVIR